jgi:hypothetical protein
MKQHSTAATFVILLAWMAFTTVFAQSSRTEHTYQLDDEQRRPPATLEDVDWLVGDWLGAAFGKQFEQVWNPASAGSMVGMFKLLDGEEVAFYELMILVEEEGSLSLKVKHFSTAFHAWEDKQHYIDFKLVSLEPNEIHFSGLSFYREDDNRMTAYIVFKDNDGGVREEKLTYQRRQH